MKKIDIKKNKLLEQLNSLSFFLNSILKINKRFFNTYEMTTFITEEVSKRIKKMREILK
jgi:hypothetical protein